MVRTLHRPPTGGETPHEFDFLEGIELDQVHHRPERTRTLRTWIYTGLALLAVVGIVVTTVLLAGRETTVDPDAYHDSGVAQAVAVHEMELASTYDSLIAQAVATHDAELAATHDALISMILRDR
jgi:hypothetical protein